MHRAQSGIFRRLAQNGVNKVVWSKLLRPLAPTETACEWV